MLYSLSHYPHVCTESTSAHPHSHQHTFTHPHTHRLLPKERRKAREIIGSHVFHLGIALRVLQCVAVRCSALQCVAVRCSALHCVAVCHSVLQCAAVCCSVLQCVAAYRLLPKESRKAREIFGSHILHF